MGSNDEEKWKSLFTSIESLSVTQNDIRSRLDSIANSLSSNNAALKEHHSRLKSLENDFSHFVSFQRARNIILFNLEDSDDFNKNLFQKVLQIFADIGLDIPDPAVDDIFRLGRMKNNRPVMIKFLAVRWVKLVFTKVRELKERNIIITNDRSKEEREHRRLLLSKIKELQAKGIKARIVGNKIIYENSSGTNIVSDTMSSSQFRGGLPMGNQHRQYNSNAETTPPTNVRPPPNPMVLRSRGRPRNSEKLQLNNFGNGTLDDFLIPNTPIQNPAPPPTKRLTASRKLSLADPQ